MLKTVTFSIKFAWEPVLNEKLCIYKFWSEYDLFTIRIYTPHWVTEDHLPREFSQPTEFFIDCGTKITAEIKFSSLQFSVTARGFRNFWNDEVPVTLSGTIKLFCEPKNEIVITAQKMKFSIKDFFSKCDQVRSFLRIWSHLLLKSLKENFIFVQCIANYNTTTTDMDIDFNTMQPLILLKQRLLLQRFSRSKILFETISRNNKNKDKIIINI